MLQNINISIISKTKIISYILYHYDQVYFCTLFIYLKKKLLLRNVAIDYRINNTINISIIFYYQCYYVTFDMKFDLSFYYTCCYLCIIGYNY